MSGRWTSWRATSPIWTVGALMVIGGVLLLVYAVRTVRS